MLRPVELTDAASHYAWAVEGIGGSKGGSRRGGVRSRDHAEVRVPKSAEGRP
jgi:hypothetical protein